MLQGVYNPHRDPWTAMHEITYREITDKMKAQATQKPPAPEDVAGRKEWMRVRKQFDNLRLERLCANLRLREPDDHIGHSILIYRVTEDELRRSPPLSPK